MPTRSITREEFDAFKPQRHPMIHVIAEEKEWYVSEGDVVIGVLLEDKTDRDWTYVVLGRDQKGNFRAVDFLASIPTIAEARAQLLSTIAKLTSTGQTVFPQD